MKDLETKKRELDEAKSEYMSVVEEGGDGRKQNISVKLAPKRLDKFVKDNG